MNEKEMEILARRWCEMKGFEFYGFNCFVQGCYFYWYHVPGSKHTRAEDIETIKKDLGGQK